MSELQEKVVADLLERTKKLEVDMHAEQEAVSGLDRVSYIHMITLRAIMSLLQKKNVFTADEWQEAMTASAKEIDSGIRSQASAPPASPEEAPPKDK